MEMAKLKELCAMMVNEGAGEKHVRDTVIKITGVDPAGVMMECYG